MLVLLGRSVLRVVILCCSVAADGSAAGQE